MKDERASAYFAYEKFESFQRPSEMNIIDYINEFEKFHYEIQRYEITLATAALLHTFLKRENLSIKKQQLARATIAESNCENMIKILKSNS